MDDLLSTIAAAIYVILCCPCFLYFRRRRRRRPGCVNEIITTSALQEVHQKLPPVPLPSSRPRALTLPLPPASPARPDCPQQQQQQQTTRAQSQSRLFSKLPLELRRMVYECVLGGDVLHIVRLTRRIAHVRCRGSSERKSWRHPCWGHQSIDGLYMGIIGSSATRTDGGVLPLLRTCRLVYTEAIDMLYSTNTFDFIDLDNIVQLAATILPRRLNAICALNLSWQFGYLAPPGSDLGAFIYPSQKEAWERVWAIIADMESLRRLQVRLEALWQVLHPEAEAGLLRPLEAVRRPRLFTVKVSWFGCEGLALEGVPFSLERSTE